MTDERISTTSPYLLDDQPTSVGRLFLARAFAHYCALHWGYSNEEIVAAFAGDGPEAVIMNVRAAARLIGEAMAREVVRAWARPIGGGKPARLEASAWELDRFDRRFATSAINPARPFDESAEPTSWIFVDVDDWNALVEASLDPHPRQHRPRTLRLGPGAPVEETGARLGPPPDSRGGVAGPERLVRLPEVERRTGMSRSTIYRRMDKGRFPKTVPMEGNIAGWRERELDEWLADPQ